MEEIKAISNNDKERSKSLMMIKPHQQHRILTADKNIHNAMNSQIPDNSKRSNSLLIVQTNSSNGILNNNNRNPQLSPMISIPKSLSINKNESTKGITTTVDAIIQGAPSNLMRLKLENSNDNKENKEYLKKRIKDLEKDVLKLTNHIQQAEHSIKNYRHCLSEKSPRHDDATSKHISIQTDIDIDTLKVEQELKSSQDKIHSLLNELKSLRELKDTFFKERKGLHDIHQKNEHVMLESIKAKEDIIKNQQLQLQSLEDTLAAYKQNQTENKSILKDDIIITTITKIDASSYHNCLNNLRKEISKVKHYYQDEISNILNTIKNEYQNRMQSILLTYLSTIDTQKIAIDELTDKIASLQNNYHTSQEYLEIANQEINQLKLLSQQLQLQLHYSSNISVIDNPIQANTSNHSNQIIVMNTNTTEENENVNNDISCDISKESIHLPYSAILSHTTQSPTSLNNSSPIAPHINNTHITLPQQQLSPPPPQQQQQQQLQQATLLSPLDSLRVIDISHTHNHLITSVLDQGCSPFRSPYTTTTSAISPTHPITNNNNNNNYNNNNISRSSPQETKYKLYIAELELEYKEKINQLEVQPQQVEAQQQQVELKHRLHMNRQDAMHSDKLKQIEGQYKQQIEACNIVKDKLMNQFNQEQIHSKHLQQCIYDANIALKGLEEVHIAEIKAIKHESHIKDLVRVNKEREVSLEKDKLLIEINHLKELQNILSFSINTAEQSLEELQPHVVVKLSQGRIKRIKLIEQNTKLRLKDLDQRSLETCAVSATHLDGFQIKANKNLKIAQEMTQLATNKLIDILKVNMS